MVFENYIRAFSAVKYAPFLAAQAVRLPANQMQKLEEILAQRGLDLTLAAKQMKPAAPGSAPGSLQSMEPTDATLAAIFSPEMLAGVKHYDRTLQQRGRLSQLIGTLVYDHDELTAVQLDTLVDSLQENLATPLRLDAPLADVDRFIRATQSGDERVLAQAQAYLTPVQLNRLNAMIAAEHAYLKYFRLRRSQTGHSLSQEGGTADPRSQPTHERAVPNSLHPAP